MNAVVPAVNSAGKTVFVEVERDPNLAHPTAPAEELTAKKEAVAEAVA